MKGTLQFAVSIVYPQPRPAEGWLNKECTSFAPFGEQRVYGSLCAFDDRAAAENIMRQLAQARFEENLPREVAGVLHKKMCLMGELETSNQYGFSVKMRSGIKLCLWKVMISDLGIVQIKERMENEVELCWYNLVAKKEEHLIVAA